MPAYGPISRRDLIEGLRKLGFRGPQGGKGKHPAFMVQGTLKLKLPNQHQGAIGRDLLKQILDRASITREQ
jgi:hypothetical protein